MQFIILQQICAVSWEIPMIYCSIKVEGIASMIILRWGSDKITMSNRPLSESELNMGMIMRYDVVVYLNIFQLLCIFSKPSDSCHTDISMAKSFNVVGINKLCWKRFLPFKLNWECAHKNDNFWWAWCIGLGRRKTIWSAGTTDLMCLILRWYLTSRGI